MKKKKIILDKSDEHILKWQNNLINLIGFTNQLIGKCLMIPLIILWCSKVTKGLTKNSSEQIKKEAENYWWPLVITFYILEIAEVRTSRLSLTPNTFSLGQTSTTGIFFKVSCRFQLQGSHASSFFFVLFGKNLDFFPYLANLLYCCTAVLYCFSWCVGKKFEVG